MIAVLEFLIDSDEEVGLQAYIGAVGDVVGADELERLVEVTALGVPELLEFEVVLGLEGVGGGSGGTGLNV